MAKFILFVCSENSARSQMAEGFFNHFNKNKGYIGVSAGTNPAKSINHYAIKVMKEKGIDITKQKPKLLTLDMAQSANKIFSMGCIKGCPVAENTDDWNLDDPKTIEEFREVRDIIEEKIKKLVSELGNS